MGFSLSDVPVVGDIYDAARGNPDEIKAAYDKAMGYSATSAEKLKQFLMGRESRAQSRFGPMQAMFQGAYGTKGMQAPQIPQAPQAGMTQMFQGGKP
jgi:hypothetical protein